MQIQFVGKNVEITPALKTFATEKIKPLERRFPQISTVHIALYVEHKTHIAEAALHYNGIEIHANAKAESMYTALDMLLDKLLGQMTKQKEKIIDNQR